MKVSIIKGDEWHHRIDLERARIILNRSCYTRIATWQMREAMQAHHKLYGWSIQPEEE